MIFDRLPVVVVAAFGFVLAWRSFCVSSSCPWPRYKASHRRRSPPFNSSAFPAAMAAELHLSVARALCCLSPPSKYGSELSVMPCFSLTYSFYLYRTEHAGTASLPFTPRPSVMAAELASAVAGLLRLLSLISLSCFALTSVP